MGILNDTVKSRVVVQTTNSLVENPQARYELLLEEIKTKTKFEIKTQIEVIKALYEIREEKLFQYGGYKSFNAFVKDYKLSRSQMYRYLSIAEGLQKNILNEKEIEEKGLKESERVFRKVSTGGHFLKKPSEKTNDTLNSKTFSIDDIPIKYKRVYNTYKKVIRERLKTVLDTAINTGGYRSKATAGLENMRDSISYDFPTEHFKNVALHDTFDAILKHVPEAAKNEIYTTLKELYKSIKDGRRVWNKKKKRPITKKG